MPRATLSCSIERASSRTPILASDDLNRTSRSNLRPASARVWRTRAVTVARTLGCRFTVWYREAIQSAVGISGWMGLDGRASGCGQPAGRQYLGSGGERERR